MITSNNMRVAFVLLLVVPLLFPTLAHSEILFIEEEKNALLDFKLSFVADPDDALSTWSKDSDDCCEWSGVQCDNRTGSVISLKVGEDLVSHELRPSLLVLQHLTSLDLSANEFNMTIPKFIGSLSKLTSLNLWLSGFSGKIPPHLGNLTKLQSLSLGDSSGLYTDNMRWLSHLSSLKDLDMGNVELSDATDWLSTLKMLPSLSTFNCSSCSLPLVPSAVSSINHLVNHSIHLTTLDLSYNSISYSNFSSLINGTNDLTLVYLTYMSLEQNLDGFLEALIHSARYTLEILNIEGNNLTILPPKLMIFPLLKFLIISHNQLSQLQAHHFRYMLNLTSLDVSYNPMTTLPDLSKLTSLTYLFASFNKISGNFHAIVHHLPANLEWLDLSSNSLNDTISDIHFSKFSMLNVLLLSENYLLTLNFSKGWVPPFKLGSLSLRSCKLGPSFPNWVLTQQSLFYLDISNSSIFGAIPTSFWNVSTSLAYLNVSNNRFQCTIPNLPLTVEISSIDLSSSEFHGPIPSFVFSALIMLDLSNNKFSSFPTFHHERSNHEASHINLSNNLLSGSLPDWIFQFDGLMLLNLANNMLSGTIPNNIGSLWQLSGLHLNNNTFSGELPSSLKNCSQLVVLELQNNHLSGSVPIWLGESLSQLIVLSLSSNNLSGDLPSNLCHLQHLQVLDLAGNRITGSVPSCVDNFTSMATHEGFNTTLFGLYNIYFAHRVGYRGFLDYALVTWKGVSVSESGRILPQLNVIDLSSNLLNGEIPNTLTCLKYLRSLDLSKNNLDGSIPDKIGELTSLEVLDLSSNRLWGEIPTSLASMSFLNTLNLSSNNLSGRIPTGTQLQSFNPSCYAENPELCGDPLPTKCLGVEKQPTHVKDNNNKEEANEPFDLEALYAALGAGFAASLLGILGILHFHARSRHTFFQMATHIADWVFVRASLCRSRIKSFESEREMDKAINRQRLLLQHLNSAITSPHFPDSSISGSICSVGKSEAYEQSVAFGDDVVIVAAHRTAICRAKRGGFKDSYPDDLLAPVLKAVIEKTNINPAEVGDIVVGTVLAPGSERAILCRMAAFYAGFPENVPIRTVNRQCSSGLQAVADVAACIKAGFYDIGIGAGLEFMTLDPVDRPKQFNPRQVDKFPQARDCLIPMGLTSENVAQRYGVTREEQDQASVRSHRNAAAATASGKFKDEIIPVFTKIVDPKTGEEKPVTISVDDGIRPTTTMADLARLKASFKKDGTTTAGNASQLSDGAGAVLLMKRSLAVKRGLPILGAFRSFSVAGVDPAVMGIGPAVAIPAAVKTAGLNLDDITLYEINEAFASQYVYCCKALNLDQEKVNVNGGAIALGHPLGATGARCVGTLLHEMKRRGKGCRFGVISMCIGTGMGAAAVFERGDFAD